MSRNRRHQVVRSAAALFRKRGFKGATIRELAEAVDLQSGSLFHYFDSKEAILFAVVSDALEVSIERMRMFGALRPKPDARMLRYVLAKLKLMPRRCVLVEDTLAHQRSARAIGMRAVWMQGYLRGTHGPEVGVHHALKPPYVYARIKSVQALRRL